MLNINNSIAIINPFRYRGYVYDDESGLYYLQNRHYMGIAETIMKMREKEISRHVYDNQFIHFVGYIINQKTDWKVSLISMGKFKGNYNGCGLIATYNLLRIVKCYNIQPWNIISYFERVYCVVTGVFGVAHWTIASYLRYIRC